MGLGKLAEMILPDLIKNEGSPETFFSEFAGRFLSGWPFPEGIRMTPLNAGELEKLILKALLKQWPDRNYFTTTEIARLINDNQPADQQRSKNNVSRYFNQRFYPYYEIKLIDGKRKYRLSNTGYGKAKLL
ncbi:hypothetical protein [Methylomonas sp. HYX-M1]|uniref:hypothetical protein n=1 Tax=Methylomonas sp. HYX-M1 TaxID=3139307 RepID=UPI00345C2F3F